MLAKESLRSGWMMSSRGFVSSVDVYVYVYVYVDAYVDAYDVDVHVFPLTGKVQHGAENGAIVI